MDLRKAIVLILTAGLLPTGVLAQEQDPGVAVDQVWVTDEEIHLSLTARGILDEGARETIDQGGTTAIIYTVALYRQRSGWFDSMVKEPVTIPFRVTYEPFERRYRLVGLDLLLKTQAFEDVAAQCTRIADVSLGSIEALGLDPDARYYVVVEAQYEPMTVETFEQLRSWMDGDRGAGEGAGEGGRRRSVGSRIAQALMSAAGLGERRLRGQSSVFRPSELPRRP